MLKDSRNKRLASPLGFDFNLLKHFDYYRKEELNKNKAPDYKDFLNETTKNKSSKKSREMS
jgi:hypothetical protein